MLKPEPQTSNKTPVGAKSTPSDSSRIPVRKETIGKVAETIERKDKRKTTNRSLGLSTLHDRRQELCSKPFNSISSPLNLLPPKHEAKYNTRRKRIYNLSYMCTDRYKHTFVPAVCIRANNALERK